MYGRIQLKISRRHLIQLKDAKRIVPNKISDTGFFRDFDIFTNIINSYLGTMFTGLLNFSKHKTFLLVIEKIINNIISLWNTERIVWVNGHVWVERFYGRIVAGHDCDHVLVWVR